MSESNKCMSLTGRLTTDTGLREFFSSYEYVYVFVDSYTVDALISLLSQMELRPIGIIVDEELSIDKFKGIKVYKLEDIELNKDIGIVLTSTSNDERFFINKIRRKSQDAGIYVSKSVRKDIFIPQDSSFTNPDEGFFGRFKILDDLGAKFGTDKCSEQHDYLRKYELFFQYFRSETFTLLELGVCYGQSINTFNGAGGGYFTSAKVIGVDINPNCRKYVPQSTFLLADASYEVVLTELRELNPSIIIDDASHFWSHQIKALFILWQSLPPGGIYIMEDIETSFLNAGYKGFDDAIVSGFEICRDISELVTGRAYLSDNNRPFAEETKKIANEVDMISFIRGSCILVKK